MGAGADALPARCAQACTQGEIDEAFAATKAAQKLWSKTPLYAPCPLHCTALLFFDESMGVRSLNLGRPTA